MGRRIAWLDERIEEFTSCYWNTDVRESRKSAEARSDLGERGLYDALRQFLCDVIRHSAVTPEEWARLFNVQVRTHAEVVEDAKDFWDWLFDDEALP